MANKNLNGSYMVESLGISSLRFKAKRKTILIPNFFVNVVEEISAPLKKRL